MEVVNRDQEARKEDGSLFDEMLPVKLLPDFNVCVGPPGAINILPTHNEASTPNFQTTDKWTDPPQQFNSTVHATQS